jgi:hypothetical protein
VLFEIQFHHVGVEQQRQVWPRQSRAQEGASDAHASPIRGDVHVGVAGAGYHRSVHVIRNGHAHLAGCLDEGWALWDEGLLDGGCGLGRPLRARHWHLPPSPPGS